MGFKEFQIVTRVVKKPHDKDYQRFEWNGIEEDSIHNVLNQIYLGNVGMLDEAEPSELWKTCVEVLEILTRSRKSIWHEAEGLSSKLINHDTQRIVRGLSILEALRVVQRRNTSVKTTNHLSFIYSGPNIFENEKKFLLQTQIEMYTVRDKVFTVNHLHCSIENS